MASVSRISVVLAIVAATISSPPSACLAEEGLKPGDVLSQENAAQAEALLPPEILRHYKDGKYKNKIVEWPSGAFRWETAFQEATLDNKGKYEVNDKGTIVDKATGEQPTYVYGFPFPDVDPNDPKAGAKILWNAYYGYWYLGNSRNAVRLVWVNPDGIDREAGQEVYFMYYDGQSEAYRVPNPSNLLMQMIATTTFPSDLQGTTALAWRYRDPEKRDATWAYVPTLRRVRAVSPNNRSDGFLGSDMSQDDGPFFDGKPEDFEWKLVESKDQLRLVDPKSLDGTADYKWLPSGGWRTIFADIPTVGFQDPEWKGLAWAPVAPALAKRPVWVIEATPKDQYYLYGKVQLYVDRETYQGVYNRKFNWRDELMNTYMILGMMSGKRTGAPDGREDWLWAANMGYQAAENVKLNRATVSGLEAPGKDPANDRRVPFDPQFFDFNTLSRFGK